ncbi:uncharacterized protein LOC119700926 [Motacilla alba alba]|uniref:uncharacterized protein LOC119700926 n=1 Tax=Motacilla alba alba TaxID=1094192 RepID=UPI0018D58015|nr:uncharacterized protein LOC119700926 [Motacilla alba alba]
MAAGPLPPARPLSPACGGAAAGARRAEETGAGAGRRRRAVPGPRRGERGHSRGRVGDHGPAPAAARRNQPPRPLYPLFFPFFSLLGFTAALRREKEESAWESGASGGDLRVRASGRCVTPLFLASGQWGFIRRPSFGGTDPRGQPEQGSAAARAGAGAKKFMDGRRAGRASAMEQGVLEPPPCCFGERGPVRPAALRASPGFALRPLSGR